MMKTLRPNSAPFQPLGPDNILSWVHFGDLHLTTKATRNYEDFGKLIAAANTHLTASGVNFALLPGDNADNGTADQYEILVEALDNLVLPLHVISGDHDIQPANLNAFNQSLYPSPDPGLPKNFRTGGHHCLFLNSVDIDGKDGFGFKDAQSHYLAQQLREAATNGERISLFMHNYPSELVKTNPVDAVTTLIRSSSEVRVIEMGHTHYNEIGNDGRVIYAATRSTGQVEEGPVGFSVTCLDGDVVSWKFKELAAPWPFVMITSPADEKFLTCFAGPVRLKTQIRAKAWVEGGTEKAWYRLGPLKYQEMYSEDRATWSHEFDPKGVPDGVYPLTVWAVDQRGESASDTINILIDRAGSYQSPRPKPVDMGNRIGAYPAKGIPGTLLGPNLLGHPW